MSKQRHSSLMKISPAAVAALLLPAALVFVGLFLLPELPGNPYWQAALPLLNSDGLSLNARDWLLLNQSITGPIAGFITGINISLTHGSNRGLALWGWYAGLLQTAILLGLLPYSLQKNRRLKLLAFFLIAICVFAPGCFEIWSNGFLAATFQSAVLFMIICVSLLSRAIKEERRVYLFAAAISSVIAILIWKPLVIFLPVAGIFCIASQQLRWLGITLFGILTGFAIATGTQNTVPQLLNLLAPGNSIFWKSGSVLVLSLIVLPTLRKHRLLNDCLPWLVLLCLGLIIELTLIQFLTAHSSTTSTSSFFQPGLLLTLCSLLVCAMTAVAHVPRTYRTAIRAVILCAAVCLLVSLSPLSTYPRLFQKLNTQRALAGLSIRLSMTDMDALRFADIALPEHPRSFEQTLATAQHYPFQPVRYHCPAISRKIPESLLASTTPVSQLTISDKQKFRTHYWRFSGSSTSASSGHGCLVALDQHLRVCGQGLFGMQILGSADSATFDHGAKYWTMYIDTRKHCIPKTIWQVVPKTQQWEQLGFAASDFPPFVPMANLKLSDLSNTNQE